MKKLFAILVVAVMVISLMPMTMSAATADWVVNSVEGTAVLDGVKDEGYDAFEPLVFETCGEGSGNGGGATLDAPLGHGYIMNDAENVYVFMDVHDPDMDNGSANNYEQDSVEIFFMEPAAVDDTGNPVAAGAKVQWRIHFDGVMDCDSGSNKPGADNCVVKVNDDGSGYVVEAKLPITEVLNNQIEILLQINSATGGARTATVYASGHPEGDNGYQRSDRDSTYDCWMTLALAGDHADTRKDPVPVAQEITVKNYQDILSRKFDTQLFAQDQVAWGWVGLGTGASAALGTTTDLVWEAIAAPAADAFTAENTKEWSAAPKFAIQLSDNAMADGDTEKFTATYTDITVKATGYADVVIPGASVEMKLIASAADWGMSGNSWEIDLGTPVREQLGLDVQTFATAYLPALTSVSTTLTYDTYNLNDLATVQAFVDNLATLEQEFVDTDETIVEQLQKANDALAAAQGANGDAKVLEDALKDANSAKNRANKTRENAGWSEGGIADTYIQTTFDGIIAEIQGLVDAAAPAEPEAPAETPNDDAAPAEDNAPSSSTTTEEGGSNTGLIVGIVVVVVIIIAVVAAVLLGKKKK